MNFFLAADKGREKRDGSALGDRLNYWDVKMSIQYDFMLKQVNNAGEKNLRRFRLLTKCAFFMPDAA